MKIYRTGACWLVTLAAVSYAGLELALNGTAFLLTIGPFVLLVLPAVFSAIRPRRPAPRLTMSFVLAALLLLAMPGGLLVGLAAAAAGRGGGVAGSYRRGLPQLAALTVSLTVAAFVTRVAAIPSNGAAGLGLGLLLLVLVQLFTFGIAVTLAGDTPPLSRAAIRSLSIELANVPLAWLLVELAADGRWLAGGILAALILIGEDALARLTATAGALRRSNSALASRVTELNTLHAIGREILSSLDPIRVCGTIERECRKILDVDLCRVALFEPRTDRLEWIFRSRPGLPAEIGRVPLRNGLARRVAREKRPQRVDELRPSADESGMRAALIAPMIVQKQTIGVLSVASRIPGAYDDHQLSVLTTIAQQAAVAFENARHYQLATVDSLTGFFLRDYFFRRLRDEHERSSRYGGWFSLLMLDLDGFKSINDRHGHVAGDAFLRTLGETIQQQLRAADLGCRYGGDEFCLLLPQTDLEGARVIAERIRVAIAEQVVRVDGLALSATASIGVAVFPDHDAADVQSLVRCADEALYRAKRSGRDCVAPWAA